MFLLYGFLFSNDFLIASVEVRGVELGDSAEVALAAGAMGESIFRIDAGHAAARVAALPYVERVTVETRFPDRVVISVTERIPAIVWRAGSERLLVDERGNVIGNVGPVDLPVVIGVETPPEIGSTLDAELVAAVRAIHEALGTRLVELRVDPLDGLTVRLDDGAIVILGTPDDTPLKLAILEEVRAQGGNWSLLDLREPARPYYK